MPQPIFGYHKTLPHINLKWPTCKGLGLRTFANWLIISWSELRQVKYVWYLRDCVFICLFCIQILKKDVFVWVVQILSWLRIRIIVMIICIMIIIIHLTNSTFKYLQILFVSILIYLCDLIYIQILTNSTPPKSWLTFIY